MTKFLLAPVVYAIVLAGIDAVIPYNLRARAFYPGLVGATAIVVAIFCARDWKEILKILAGLGVGGVCGFLTILPCAEPLCLLVGPVAGLFAMRFFALALRAIPKHLQEIEIGV